MTVIPGKARNLVGLLRLGSQLWLRGVYAEHIRLAQCELRGCVRNDKVLFVLTIIFSALLFKTSHAVTAVKNKKPNIEYRRIREYLILKNA